MARSQTQRDTKAGLADGLEHDHQVPFRGAGASQFLQLVPARIGGQARSGRDGAVDPPDASPGPAGTPRDGYASEAASVLIPGNFPSQTWSAAPRRRRWVVRAG